MVERVRSWDCASCIHLQKQEYTQSGNTDAKLYGCSSQQRNGNVVGWCSKESELKYQSGSCCNILRVGDKIRKKSRFNEQSITYLYCGRIGTKYLLYSGKFNTKLVERDYFRTQMGALDNTLSVVKQNQVQLEASRSMAKKRRKMFIEKYAEKGIHNKYAGF